MKPSRIRVIAIGLFRDCGRILVFEGHNTAKTDWFYRPLGGLVEPGETTEETLHREMREELGKEITDLRLLAVLENLFTYDGSAGHEIVFVHDARFLDDSVYALDGLQEITFNDDGVNTKAMWRTLDSFDATHHLVPEGLTALLQKKDAAA